MKTELETRRTTNEKTILIIMIISIIIIIAITLLSYMKY